MSFFYDFVDALSIEDLTGEVCCNLVFGRAVKILANFKIEDLNECEIVLKCKKFKIKIIGENLKISTIAKGEIEVAGNVVGVVKI